MPIQPIGRRSFFIALCAAAALPPIPARAQAGAYANALGMVRSMAQAVAEIAELFERFTASAYRLQDTVDRRLEEDELEELHQQVVSLSQTQEAMLHEWPTLVSPPSEARWRDGLAALAFVHYRVSRMAQAVADYRGAFARHGGFRALRRAMTLRNALLRELRRLPRPRTGPALVQVNRIRAEYQRLVNQLDRLAEAMERYLRSLGRA